MNEYLTQNKELEDELKKCSKSLLIRIILDRCVGHPYNNLKIKHIKNYKRDAKLEELQKRIEDLDEQFDKSECSTYQDILKRNRLLEESIKLDCKYRKLLLEEE